MLSLAILVFASSSALSLSDGTGSPARHDPAELALRLCGAVDQATPERRRAAAEMLAADKSATLEEWVSVAEAFAPMPESLDPGAQKVTASLTVLGKVEPTELWIFVPPGYDHSVSTPLLVDLHGSGGDGRQGMGSWTAVAEELGAILLAPTEAGPNMGFSGEPRERRAVLEAIRWTRRRLNVDENRVWLTGYSRGGILAWDIALRFPGRFAGVAPMAGAPRIGPTTGRNNMRYLDHLAGLQLRALAGDRDQAGLVWSLRFAEGRWKERGVESAALELVGGAGHSFVAVQGRGWVDWFRAAKRDPWPSSVVRCASRMDEAERRWVHIDELGRKVADEFNPTVRTRKGVTLSQEQLRERVIDLVESRTARCAARYLGDGKIEVDTKRVKKTTLLVSADWIPEDGRLSVRLNGRKKRKKVTLDKAVLLMEFVRSFDRTFLPVGKVTL